MSKGKTWITGAVAALVAGTVLAVFQPTITSAVASQGTTLNQEYGHRGGMLGGLDLGLKGGIMETVRSVLGMELGDLKKEVRTGKSLVGIAQSKGISEGKLIASIKAEISSNIDEKVKQGVLTQEQATKLVSKLNAERIKADLNRVPRMGGKGAGALMGPGRGLQGGIMGAVSTILGLDQADLKKELQAGKTLVGIAATKGISEDKLVETVKTQIKSSIDEKVKQGNLTQDQADEIKGKMTDEHIKAGLNLVHPRGGKGFGRGVFRGPRGRN